PFSRQGNYLQIDNAIVDYIMPNVSANAFRVLMSILRKTHGWQREDDNISYTELMEISGIKNRLTISKCLKELLEIGIVLAAKFNDKMTPNSYKINRDFEVEIDKNSSTETVPDQYKKRTSGSTETV